MTALFSFTCRLCGHQNNTAGLSLGSLPVCNQFAAVAGSNTKVALDVVECAACQLIQLQDTPQLSILVPHQPWIRYREPEAHLDALVEAVAGISSPARSAIGVGPFEQPLLSRLAARGLSTAALDLDAQPSEYRYPYLESWQAMLTAPRLSDIAAQMGKFDLVSCRYIIEHVPAPVAALRAMKTLLKPGGLLLIEVPDSSTFLNARDYCFLWEEHTSYFVEGTLRRLGEVAGYRIRNVLRYPGALEDALVAVLEVDNTAVAPSSSLGPSDVFRAYREGFSPAKKALQNKLGTASDPVRNGVALFGVGHQAIMFVNAFQLSDFISLAVDDDANKNGLFPPGFRTPVVTSDELLRDDRIRTCLFAVSPQIQVRAQAKLAPLAARSVEFKSIYAGVDDSIFKDLV